MVDDHAAAPSEGDVRSLAGGGLAILVVMTVLVFLAVLVVLVFLAWAGVDDSVLDRDVRGHGGTSCGIVVTLAESLVALLLDSLVTLEGES